MALLLKNTRVTGRVVQGVKLLSSKCEAQSSNPSTTKKKKTRLSRVSLWCYTPAKFTLSLSLGGIKVGELNLESISVYPIC
jgi:hypothetical protein